MYTGKMSIIFLKEIKSSVLYLGEIKLKGWVSL